MNSTNQNYTDVSISQLEEVFAAFNQVSADLGSNYRDLEMQVASLSEELAATHSARIRELTEKSQLAAKLSALMAALPGGVVVLDSQSTVSEENPAAIHILGSSFQGTSWNEALQVAPSIETPLEGEVSLRNGKRVSIGSSSYGQKGDTIILLTDVTESSRLNDLMNREQKLAALGEMAARLAHQVRTPLSSAILYLSHLEFPTSRKDSSRSISGKILSRLRQIERLVEGMLSYIRGDCTDNKKFSLRQLLIDVEDSASTQLQSANGSLVLANSAHACMINGDREALYNAISNLIENSIQAKPKSPRLSLSLVQDEGSYVVTIEDNGPGIEPSIRERVFEPFFSTRSIGTGLGLAVVLSVVRAHGGEVSIHTATSGGASIKLSLPDHGQPISNDSGIWASGPDSTLNHRMHEPIKTTNRGVRREG